MQIKFDKYGAIINPNLHDANLIKIELTSSDVVLLINDINKINYELVLSGIVKFRVCDFQEGNIIFEIIFEQNEKEIDNKICKLYAVSKEALQKDYFRNIIEKIKKSSLVLVTLSCSYGCELYALCDDVMCKTTEEKGEETGNSSF